MKIKPETVLWLIVIVALLAVITQQSMALHQSWKNEHTLSKQKGNK